MKKDKLQELKEKIALQRSKLPKPKSYWQVRAELMAGSVKNGKA